MKQTGTCSFPFLKLILIPQLSSVGEEEMGFVTNEPLEEIIDWNGITATPEFHFSLSLQVWLSWEGVDVLLWAALWSSELLKCWLCEGL